jgi:DNA-binding FrmR family transcriptional regulator
MFGLGSRQSSHLRLTKHDQDTLNRQINMVIGQLRRIQDEVILNDACDETLTQVLAARGGINKLVTDLVGLGILDCLKGKKQKELTIAIQNLLKAI